MQWLKQLLRSYAASRDDATLVFALNCRVPGFNFKNEPASSYHSIGCIKNCGFFACQFDGALRTEIDCPIRLRPELSALEPNVPARMDFIGLASLQGGAQVIRTEFNIVKDRPHSAGMVKRPALLVELHPFRPDPEIVEH